MPFVPRLRSLAAPLARVSDAAGDASQSAHRQPSKEKILGALRGAGKSGCRSMNRLLPAGQALENAPDVERRPGEDGQAAFMGVCPREASCYLAEGPAGMRRGCARPGTTLVRKDPWGSMSGARSTLEKLQVPNRRSDPQGHEHRHQHHQHHQHQHEGQGEKGNPTSPKETSPPASHRCLSGDMSRHVHF